MSLEELVSEWEIDEIDIELDAGNAPDVVAFRHGVPLEDVRRYRRVVTGSKRPRWSEGEIAFVRDNYRGHGKTWSGWEFLQRTWDSVRKMASKLKVRQREARQ